LSAVPTSAHAADRDRLQGGAGDFASLVIAALKVLVATACEVAPRGATGTAVEGEEQRVLAAEDAYVAAEVNRDEPALRRLIDDQFVYKSPSLPRLSETVVMQESLSLEGEMESEDVEREREWNWRRGTCQHE
jgi:hypothetical protein